MRFSLIHSVIVCNLFLAKKPFRSFQSFNFRNYLNIRTPPPTRPPRASFSNSALKGLPKILTLTSSPIPLTKCVRACYFGWEPHSPIRDNSSSPGSRACRVGIRCRAVGVGLPFGFTDLRFSEGMPRSPFSALTSYLECHKIWRKVYPFG